MNVVTQSRDCRFLVRQIFLKACIEPIYELIKRRKTISCSACRCKRPGSDLGHQQGCQTSRAVYKELALWTVQNLRCINLFYKIADIAENMYLIWSYEDYQDEPISAEDILVFWASFPIHDLYNYGFWREELYKLILTRPIPMII